MPEYYFDIETPGKDKSGELALSIAWQRIQCNRPQGKLQGMKSWKDGGQKAVLKKVLELGVFDTQSPTKWDFIPVGRNLNFDFLTLNDRMRETGVKNWSLESVFDFLHNKPMKDLDTTLILMNDGNFKGSGLDQFTAKKPGTGADVIEMGMNGDLDSIDRYIEGEVAGFMELYHAIAEELAKFGKPLRERAKPTPR